MSLALVQGYSSDEEAERLVQDVSTDDSSDEEKQFLPSNSPPSPPSRMVSSLETSSLLPSADHIFLEVTGPPEFLKSSATDPIPSRPRDVRQSKQSTRLGFDRPNGNGMSSREDQPHNPPPGAVVAAKAQLVGVGDWVRDDLNIPDDGSRKAPGASIPPPEDAAILLRICLRCGVPKTYSGSKESMVCPLCNDRPATDTTATEAEKRSGSKIKDKERNKRMKGQSSHATWKSESEMQLRQQFD